MLAHSSKALERLSWGRLRGLVANLSSILSFNSSSRASAICWPALSYRYFSSLWLGFTFASVADEMLSASLSEFVSETELAEVLSCGKNFLLSLCVG